MVAHAPSSSADQAARAPVGGRLRRTLGGHLHDLRLHHAVCGSSTVRQVPLDRSKPVGGKALAPARRLNAADVEHLGNGDALE